MINYKQLQLTYHCKYYFSEAFYQKVSPTFAKSVEAALTKDNRGTIYTDKAEFIAAKKPQVFL